MSTVALRWATPLVTLVCMGLMLLIIMNRDISLLGLDVSSLQSFKIMFISLILEAFPFILLGVLASSLLQVFVSDKMIQRLTPKNPIGGILFGSLLGILFPLCECGMIPVVRRLIRKGMPAYIGIVFILAGPILNPIVYTSTYTAFRSQPQIAYSRMGLAFAVTVIIGLLLYRFMRRSPLKDAHVHHEYHNHDHDHHGHHPGHSHGTRSQHEHAYISSHHHPAHSDHHHHGTGQHSHDEHHRNGSTRRSRFASILAHASDEFFEMGKYLLFGALLTAFIQVSLSRETLIGIGDHPVLSNLFMMGFAFILSICSTSDAFVASSFSGTFNAGSLLAFLVFGAMIDLKNTLMLFSVFRARIVLWIIVLTFVLVLAGSYLFQYFFF
ncbi:permease [Paenibacillus pinihumi]|uniref:permease n=1 Tax=Paenibacillus pinihumi TaxID=669462 RepID=UPI0004095352|nr:permease [Paenibacillus pinihumi]